MTLQHQVDRPKQVNHTRLTRNLHELLQELRVTQTGVQILTGFLLTLPFSARFAQLTGTQRVVYLAILSGSVIATGLIVAPVAFHRMLFQRGQRAWIVTNANRAARAGLLSLALTTSGVVWLVFDLVSGPFAAGVAGAMSLLFFVTLWAAVPLIGHRGAPPSRSYDREAAPSRGLTSVSLPPVTAAATSASRRAVLRPVTVPRGSRRGLLVQPQRRPWSRSP